MKVIYITNISHLPTEHKFTFHPRLIVTAAHQQFQRLTNHHGENMSVFFNFVLSCHCHIFSSCEDYMKLSLNMAVQLAVVPSIVEELMNKITLWVNIRTNYWTAERAIIASNVKRGKPSSKSRTAKNTNKREGSSNEPPTSGRYFPKCQPRQ